MNLSVSYKKIINQQKSCFVQAFSLLFIFKRFYSALFLLQHEKYKHIFSQEKKLEESTCWLKYVSLICNEFLVSIQSSEQFYIAFLIADMTLL